MKINVSPPRILFLDSSMSHPHHQSAVKHAVGADNVYIIGIGNDIISSVAITICIVLWLTIITGIGLIFHYTGGLWGCISIGIGAVLGTLLSIIILKVKKFFLFYQFQLKAEYIWKLFRPNLIFAVGDGAVCALSMRTPPLPLVLMSPSQGRFSAEMFLNKNYFSVKKFPFLVICHGVSDSVIPLDDTLQLLQKIPDHQFHLVTLDSYDSQLKEVLTEEEIRQIIHYAYHEGWISAFSATSKRTEKKLKQVDFGVLLLKDIISFATLALARIKKKDPLMTHMPLIEETMEDETRSDPFPNDLEGMLSEDSDSLKVKSSQGIITKPPMIQWRLGQDAGNEIESSLKELLSNSIEYV